MRILLDPPKPDSPTFEIDHQIAVALAALHGSLIKIRGAGRFGNQGASILLERDGDADPALTALSRVGIRAVVGTNKIDSFVLSDAKRHEGRDLKIEHGELRKRT
jgi:hypothetical protein